MSSFLKSESGAVTVDWVVLTAALVGLGLAAMLVISGGVEDLSNDISDELETDIIITSFEPNPSSYLPTVSVYGGGCDTFAGTQRCGTTGFQRTDVTMSNGATYQVETVTVYNDSFGRYDKVSVWRDDNGDQIAPDDWPEADDSIYVEGFGGWQGMEANPV